MADPSFGPAVVQHGGLLVGTTAHAAPGTASAVPAVRAFRVPVPGRAASAAHVATAHAAASTGHRAARSARRRMIVVIGAITVASGRGAQVGAGSVRERRAPVTGTASAATTGVTGSRVVVTAPGQAASGRR